MKNTLAENMLRFGVKNLKESDLKKISEALLTEEAKPWQPFKSVNPKSWTIKAETQEKAQALASSMTLSVGNLNTEEAIKGKYGMWCLEKIPGYTGTDRYQLRQDARAALQAAASDVLLTMAVNGVYNANVYKDYVTTVKAANGVVSKLRGAHLSQMNNPWHLGQAKGWQTSTSTYNNADIMKQSSWEAILPLIKMGIDKFIATYVVTPVTAAPASKTPTTTAPNTGN